MPQKSKIDEILDRELASPIIAPENTPTQDTSAGEIPPQQVYNYLIQKGVSDEHAKGMLANIKAESQFKPGVKEQGVSVGGIGLFQHTADRREALKNAVPDWQDNWQGQIDYALSEPDTQKYLGTKFNSAEEATHWFTKNWERPVNASSKAAHRAANIPDVKKAEIDAILDAAGISSDAPSAPTDPNTEVANILAPQASAIKQHPIASTGLAFSKSLIDALGVGALSRAAGKTKIGRGLSENFNNGLDILQSLVTQGDLSAYQPKTVEERAKVNQGIIEASQKEHPIASGAGTVSGVLGQAAVLNPVFKTLGLGATAAAAGQTLSKSAKVANAAKMLTEGAIQGGVYEGLSDKDATLGKVAKSAALGAATAGIMAPVLAGAKAVAKGFGNVMINFATKTKKPEIANYITDFIGPTLNKASLINKNQKVLDVTETALQKHLKKTPGVINLGDEVIPQDIVKLALREENAGNRKLMDEYLSLASEVEQSKGQVSASLANKLKRVFWKESRFKKSGDPSIAAPAKAAYDKGVFLMKMIEDLAGSGTVKSLNRKAQNGIELSHALDAVSNPSRLRAYMEVMTGISNPSTIPLMAAGRVATSIPGATLLGAAATRVPKAVTPSVQTLMNTLVPQALKKKKVDKR